MHIFSNSIISASKRLAIFVLLNFIVLGVCVLPQVDARTSYTKDEIRALYLFNLLKYTSWPDDSDNTYQVCSIGNIKQRPYKQLVTKLVDNTPIDYKPINARDDMRLCNLVYFGFIDDDVKRSALGRLKDAPVLTVGNDRDFVEIGGMIAIVVGATKNSLLINNEKVQESGLTLSSSLLDIAELVSIGTGE